MAACLAVVPDHPLFNFPNKITDEDWKGWTQERGLYFLSDWDARYTPLLASSDDPGNPLKGGQLVAERFPAAGRHHDDHVLAGQHGFDHTVLSFAETAETEMAFESGLRVVECRHDQE